MLVPGNKKDSAPKCKAFGSYCYDAMRAAERSVLISLKSELAIRAVELDQGLGGSVLKRPGLVILGDGRSDLLGELLAQLDAPLIVGVQTPHGALDEGDVLVQGDELAERERGRKATPKMEVVGRL